MRRGYQGSLLVAVGLVAAFPAAIWAQTPVGGEFQVNTYTTDNQLVTRSAVAVAPDGSFVVVWNGPGDGSSSGIFGQRYDSKGIRIGGEFQVNSYTTYYQGVASVAMSPSGQFVVAWLGYGDGGSGTYGYYGIFARRFAADGTARGEDFRVNSITTYYQNRPAVAIAPSGDFVVAWQSGSFYDVDGQDGSSAGIFARRFAADGTPRGDDFQVNSFTLGTQYEPAIASAANGDFVVVWNSYGYYTYGQDGSYGGIFGQRFSKSGAPIGGEFQANTNTAYFQGQANVASRTNGNFIVVWSSFAQDGSGTGIFGQRFDAAGEPQGEEFQVNAYTTSGQTFPSVAVRRNGGFVVAWRSLDQDGDSYGVFGRLFSAQGAPVGDDFQVNTYITGRQGGSRSVAALPNGDFVVIWVSRDEPPSPGGQDGSGLGVFGRRYRR